MRGWQSRAACHDADPELFFPSGRDDSLLVTAHLRKVRPICGACPVALECLRWSIDTGQEHGLWAATTPTERRRERRRAREQRRPTAQSDGPYPDADALQTPTPVAVPALAAGGAR